MKKLPTPLDLKQLKVFPLEQRLSEATIEDTLINLDAPPPALPNNLMQVVRETAKSIATAHKKRASVMLLYGAHIIKNGGAPIMNALMELGWITHLGTNGAGTIHDWEFSFLGRSTESVKKNVATGTFGTWDETGRNIHLALLAGALENQGYGQSLGRFIMEEGTTLPSTDSLIELICKHPTHPLTPARTELLQAMVTHNLPADRISVPHPWKQHSVLGNAFRLGVPLTVHPGIGYDIITNHPMFNGAAIGRAADIDFRLLSTAVDNLEGGLVLSVGSAIMAPQVFEKSISCVNNIRLQNGRAIVHNHTFYIVDLQDGGNWDWTKGEPPKENPAYYLRFCKSFSRMGGTMHYLQLDNVAFLHNLYHLLK
ncbi:hypothetical protein [Pedosphaera parvula]|uniref:Deoxyhypusine synthase n=1 Tax=Pedosphaera parvula (strain Ellin514) TaxID=320771 RepID=B9XFS8_PEDPL|nr:hypothetical protein [Pedosphaera parvula]EEF61442.1 conserved hypothetical protein [Pedosphaera parvula Ellin514]